MGRTVTKSIAIIGEGETEWFYFDSLRVACRYPFKVAPDFPQHSDINHILKLVESYLNLKSASNLNGNLNCSKELEHYAS